MEQGREQGGRRFRRVRFVALAGAAVVLLGLYWFAWPGRAQAPAPGSEADPLISKSYLESYLAERYGLLEDRLASLTERVNALERQVKALQQQLGEQPAGAARIILRVGSRTAYVGGKQQILDQAPYLAKGTVMVPFRFIGEALGATVGWESQSKKITYRLGEVNIAFQVGQAWVEVNGQRRQLEVAPQLVGGTTMVPLRVVAEYLGAAVSWDGTKKEITISL